MMTEPRAEDAGKPRMRGSWRFWVLGGVLVLGVVGYGIGSPIFRLNQEYEAIQAEFMGIKGAVKARNLVALQSDIQKMADTVHQMDKTVGSLGYWQSVPGLGEAYTDIADAVDAADAGLTGIQDLMPALSRMAPILGYGSSGNSASQFSDGQAVKEFLRYLPQLGPALKTAYPHFVAANLDLQAIDSEAFPLVPADVRANIPAVQGAVATVVNRLPIFYRSARVLQAILGDPKPQRYFLWIQNVQDARPSGGAPIGYALVTVNHGVWQAHYLNPSRRITGQKTKTWGSLIKFWALNPNPDFPQAARQFEAMYQKIPGGLPLNGVLVVNSNVLKNLLAIAGSVRIDGHTIDVHNFDAVLAHWSDQGDSSAVALLWQALLRHAMDAQGISAARVLHAFGQSLDNKGILVYFNDPKEEHLLGQYRWTGKMEQVAPNDYLAIYAQPLLGGNEGSRITRIVTDVARVGERFEQTVGVTFRVTSEPPHPTDRLWIRWFLPYGSQLVRSEGIHVTASMDGRLHKTVLSGEVGVARHVQTLSIRVVYWLPRHIVADRLYLQKPPGTGAIRVEAQWGETKKAFWLTRDRVVQR